MTVKHLLAGVLIASLATTVAAQPPKGKSGRGAEPLKRLPQNHYRINHGGKPYYFWGGHFYSNSGGLYVSITAPLGAIIPALPGGFITIGTGPDRYFYYGGVYYRPTANGYVVVEGPQQTEQTLPDEEDSRRIIIYPAAGQSEEQRGRDRYECHLWAVQETGFDPTLAESDASLREDYTRAMGACLEARDYVVK